MESPKITLRNVICRHDICVNTGYGGSTVHIIVFMDPRDHETYYWKAVNAWGWEEGKTYNITARSEGDQRLSHVTSFEDPKPDPDAKSEQDDSRKNALDILLPDTHLTNDEKYDMIIKMERSEKACLKK